MLLQKIVKNVRMMVHMHVGWMDRIADIKYYKEIPQHLSGGFFVQNVDSSILYDHAYTLGERGDKVPSLMCTDK